MLYFEFMARIEVEFFGRSHWTPERFRQGVEAINKGLYPKYRNPVGTGDRKFAVSCFGRWMGQAFIVGARSRNIGVKIKVESLRLGKVLGRLYEKDPHPKLKRPSQGNTLVFEWQKE